MEIFGELAIGIGSFVKIDPPSNVPSGIKKTSSVTYRAGLFLFGNTMIMLGQLADESEEAYGVRD